MQLQRPLSKATAPELAPQASSEAASDLTGQDALGNAALQAQLAAAPPDDADGDWSPAESDRMTSMPADPDDPRELPEKVSDLRAAVSEVEGMMGRGMRIDEVRAELPALTDAYELQWLRLTETSPHRYAPEGKVNPVIVGGAFVLFDGDELIELGGMLAVAFGSNVPVDIQQVRDDFAADFGAFTGADPFLAWMSASLADWRAYQLARIGGDLGAQFLPTQAPDSPITAVLSDEVQDVYASIIQRPANYVDPKLKKEDKSGDVGSSGGPSAIVIGKKPDELPSSKPAVDALRERARGRVTQNSWSEDQVERIATLVTDLDRLQVLYVANTEQAPEEIFAAPGSGLIPVYRTDTVDIPANQAQPFPLEFDYQDGNYVYWVTLLESGGKDGIPALPGKGPFAVRRTPPSVHASAVGRAFTGDQGFFPNPAYWGKRPVDDSVPRPGTRVGGRGRSAITQFVDLDAAVNGGMVAQDAAPTEPWVFCVPDRFTKDKQPDPRQGANPGLRRARLDRPFDALAEERRIKRATVYQTRRPTKGRKDDGREPQQVAGGIAASRFMDDPDGLSDIPAYPPSQRGTLASHEYCHMVGDGDEGDCDIGNLLVGTSGVNTEQLAMEETLRPFRAEFRRLGYAVRLTVTAIVDDTPFDASAESEEDRIDWPHHAMAQWIQYAISIIPIDKALEKQEPVPVHTQIMDGQRGVITEAEVDMLKKTVGGKLAARVRELTDVGAKLSGEPLDPPSKAVYEDSRRGKYLPSSPSHGWDDELSDDEVFSMDLVGLGGQKDSGKQKQGDRSARVATLHAHALEALLDDPADEVDGVRVGRFSQGDYVGGGTACAGTSLRAAETLLHLGFDGTDVEATVRQGVTDYLAVQAAHPGAGNMLASYEMRNSPEVAYQLELVSAFTVQHGDFARLRDALEHEDIAVTITAGLYTMTAANVGGTFGVFDSHRNAIHTTAYTETFANIQALMIGIKEMIVQHNVNLHSDIAVEVLQAG